MICSCQEHPKSPAFNKAQQDARKSLKRKHLKTRYFRLEPLSVLGTGVASLESDTCRDIFVETVNNLACVFANPQVVTTGDASCKAFPDMSLQDILKFFR